MSAISQLLLTRFWWNFKGMFLGTSRTNSNCHGDICPGNICPGNICPYEEYLSCYWPNFDETLQVGYWEHLEKIPTVKVTFVQIVFVLVTFVHIRNISCYWHDLDQTLKARSRQSQCKVESRLGKGQGKVKAGSRQGQGKFMARSRRGLGKVKARSRQGREASSTTVIALMSIR